MLLPADLQSLGIRDIVALDAEYISRKGEHVIPVCLCAKSLVSGAERRVFNKTSTPTPCPFPDDLTTLFVSFAAPAEWSYYLSSGWQLPQLIIDLFAEEMLLTNTQKDDKGKRKTPTLLATLSKYGLDAITAAEKHDMRDLILRGGPYSDDEQASILEYCMSDVIALEGLLPAMLPLINIREALVRGSYTRAVAWADFNGVPVDIPTYHELCDKWGAVKANLAAAVEREHGYGVYVMDKKGAMKWSTEGFENLVARLELQDVWPKTATGKYKTADPERGSEDDKVFKNMAQRCPYLMPLRQTRATLTGIRNFDLPIGPDGRCRTFPWPWVSVTGRNQPRKGFIFGLPFWARNLIKPPQGRALAYVDLVSAEFGIAGALSGDTEMLAAYKSGEDVYIRLAKMAGAVPADATKQSHRDERALYKTALLAAQYGQTAFSFAKNSGCSIQLAKIVHENLRKAYPSYWAWIDHERIVAGINKTMSSPMGWRIPVTPDTKDNLLLDFPMQASCADILRLATSFMVDEGIALCAMIHDAVLIEGSDKEIELDVETVQKCWKRASGVVLGGFELDSDAKIIRYPHTYATPEGQAMYETVRRLLSEVQVAA